MLTRSICLFILSLGLIPGFAQDIHFSQYFASPLTLNPAHTAKFNGSFRLAANYRNQWFTIPGSTPYVTFSGSFDIALMRKILEFDQLGVGVLFFNDKSGNGELTNLTLLGSIAYHKTLDRFNRHQVSLGFQGGFVQKRIDFSKLTFEEQYDADIGFNPLLPNGENIENDKISYADFNGGALWHSAFTDNINLMVGVAYHHITEPKESFLVDDDSENTLNSRITTHAALYTRISDMFSLTPGLLFMTQSRAREITAGTAFGIQFEEMTVLHLGAWYRVQDAILAYAGFEYSGFRMGLSYDINVSDLKTVSNGNGAIEISLIYIHNEEPQRRVAPVKYCPRF